MEQLLLVTSCDSPAGIGASLRPHNGNTTDGLTNGWTDRRDVGNSILDLVKKLVFHELSTIARFPLFRLLLYREYTVFCRFSEKELSLLLKLLNFFAL